MTAKYIYDCVIYDGQNTFDSMIEDINSRAEEGWEVISHSHSVGGNLTVILGKRNES